MATSSGLGQTPIKTDLLIIGGGVAGLWTAVRAAMQGLGCVLVERNALGSGQTMASQGVIHGGVKYAAGANLDAGKAIAGMPEIWDQSLTGEGDVNLREAQILSRSNYLWTTGGLVSRLAGVAASNLLRTKVDNVPDEKRPEVLSRAGSVYEVAEKILNAQSVVKALAEQAGVYGAGMILGEVKSIQQNAGRFHVRLASGQEMDARVCVLAAGQGNHVLLKMALGSETLSEKEAGMQLRPLHMVMARAKELPRLYGHCVAGSLSDKPRLTVTTHWHLSSSDQIWYIGGNVAETGIHRSPVEQVKFAREELQACVSGVDFEKVRWATLRINRAEGLTPEGKRPDGPAIREYLGGKLLAVWPTKLAFAPQVADDILKKLWESGNERTEDRPQDVVEWPRVPLGTFPWDDAQVEWMKI